MEVYGLFLFNNPMAKTKLMPEEVRIMKPLAAREETFRISKCMTGRTDIQTAEIIRKYINDIPERWNKALEVLSYEAIIKSCKE